MTKKKLKTKLESEKQNNFCTWSRILHPFNGCCLCREKMAWRHFSSSTHGMVVHGWGVVLQVCIYWPLTLEATREIALGQFLFSWTSIIILNQNLNFSWLFININRKESEKKRFLMCNEALIFQHFFLSVKSFGMDLEFGFRVCGKLGQHYLSQKLIKFWSFCTEFLYLKIDDFRIIEFLGFFFCAKIQIFYKNGALIKYKSDIFGVKFQIFHENLMSSHKWYLILAQKFKFFIRKWGWQS